jgi:hypothetical protein
MFKATLFFKEEDAVNQARANIAAGQGKSLRLNLYDRAANRFLLRCLLTFRLARHD